MGNLYILIGDHFTRKSASIRALTGFSRNNKNALRPIDVKLENDDIIKLCVFSQSPQEEGISIRDFETKIANIAPDWNILMSLRMDERAIEYIGTIPVSNRNNIYIVPLGIANIPENIQRQFEESQLNMNILNPGIEDSSNMPANEIAHVIRGEWNWL